MKYAGEIGMPFYIWHQTVIVVIAFAVVQWPVGAPAKYLVIAVASLAVTVLLCELTRRNAVTRFLFGMKAQRPTSGS